MTSTIAFVCLGVLLTVSADPGPKPRIETRPALIYMNEFAVHVPEGPDAADTIARKHGFENHGQVRKLRQTLHYGPLI